MTNKSFIVVIGTSAGGNVLLPELLEQFSADMNIAVFIVTHLSRQAIGDMLVSRLQKHTEFTCRIPDHNETIKSRHVYLAKPDHHLILKMNKILLGKGPMENRYRPSIDTLFRSAAVEFGSHVIGIILTGMLEDGASGMLAIKKSGGTCIIQEPNEAQYPDMPRAVLSNLKPDYAIPISQMGRAILETIKRGKKKQPKIPLEIIKEAEIAERVHLGIDGVEDLGERSPFSCPDCGGAIWEIKNNDESRYRCHVGHAYTEQGLLSNMGTSAEAALWTALRIIEERRNLLKKIADKEKQNGLRKLAGHYSKQIEELGNQIQLLKNSLFINGSD
jgi:two-component system chemotaxis response regulator CheB